MASVAQASLSLSREHRYFLNAVQVHRLTRFFHERVYDYAPKGSSIACKIPLLALIKNYVEQLGDCVKEVFVKGGLFHYARTGECGPLLSDLDFEIQVVETANWYRIEQVFRAVVASFTGATCNFEDSQVAWWSARCLRKKPNSTFALYGLPTSFQGISQPIEITVKLRLKNACIGSGDSLRAEISPLLRQENPNVPIQAVDEYPVGLCLGLLERRQFTVQPMERIGQLINGFFTYCHVLSRGSYPKDPQIEQAFLDAFSQCHMMTLTAYLAKHYPNDREGMILYLLNHYHILNRCHIDKKTREAIERTLFGPLCAALGGSSEPYTHKEMRAFFLYATCYLYLRSSERESARDWPEGHFLVRARRADPERVGNDFLFVSLPEATLKSLRTLEHPLMVPLIQLFPCKSADLAAFFQEHLAEKLPVEDPVPAKAPPPPPSLREQIGKRPVAEIMRLYQEQPDPHCLPLIAEVSLPAFFILLPVEFDATKIFEQHPQEALAFLLQAPPCFAKKYLWLNPTALIERFGKVLCIGSLPNISLCAKTLPFGMLTKLYGPLEPHLLEEEEPVFLDAFLPFFFVLYPKEKNKLKQGLQRLMQSKAGGSLAVLEHLARYQEALRPMVELQQWFQAQVALLKAPSDLIRQALPHVVASVEDTAPPSMAPMEKAFAQLLDHPEEACETLFGLLLIATVKNEFIPSVLKVHQRLKSFYDRKSLRPETKTQLYLFNVHILLFAIQRQKELHSMLDLLVGVIQSGLQRHILSLEVLQRVNAIADKVQVAEDESVVFRSRPQYWGDLVFILLSSSEGRQALRTIAKHMTASFSNPSHAYHFLAAMVRQTLELLPSQCLHEPLHYVEQAFQLLQSQAPKMPPAIWSDMLTRSLQVAQQIGKKRAEIPQEEFERLRNKGENLCGRIQEAVYKLPFAVRFVNPAPLTEHFMTLMGEAKAHAVHNQWPHFQQALGPLRAGIQYLESKGLEKKLGVEAVLAIWAVATGMLIHKDQNPSVPEAEWIEMQRALFDLMKRARATLPRTLFISASAEGKSLDEIKEEGKMCDWIVQLLNRTQGIGNTPAEFFRLIDPARLAAQNVPDL